MGLGSGIWKKPLPDPGSRGQKGTGSGSATLMRTYKYTATVVQHCTFVGTISKLLITSLKHVRNYVG
jgi:hypothetical protein